MAHPIKIRRRDILCENTATELLIRTVVHKVEKLGADEKLTNAIQLITSAFDLVADFEDARIDKKKSAGKPTT